LSTAAYRYTSSVKHQVSYRTITGGYFAGLKRPKREVIHKLTHNVEV